MKINRPLKYLTRNEPQKTISKHGIVYRRLIYPIIRRLSGPISGAKGVLVRSEFLPKGPKIFAVTHTYSREDISWGISFADEQSFLITNAYQELLYTSDGWALWASGIILVDRYDKENRRASIEKAKRVIEFGGNVMIFPEATWNQSPNLLVQKLYPGVYRIAKQTRVPIIPISTMVYDDICYVSRGEPIYVDDYDQQEGLSIIRDSLATLKWEIMEEYGKTTRKELLNGMLPDEYWNDHLEDYIAKQTIYEREEENHARFIDASDIEYEQYLHHMDSIMPRCENAFLFNKKKP